MSSLQVQLEDTAKAFADAQVASGRFPTVNEYLQALIDADRQRQAWERLETLVEEGLNSGDPLPVTPEFWAERRRRLQMGIEMA